MPTAVSPILLIAAAAVGFCLISYVVGGRRALVGALIGFPPVLASIYALDAVGGPAWTVVLACPVWIFWLLSRRDATGRGPRPRGLRRRQAAVVAAGPAAILGVEALKRIGLPIWLMLLPPVAWTLWRRATQPRPQPAIGTPAAVPAEELPDD